MRIGIIGGGASGFFAAIRCAELNPAARITIFERGQTVLEKVRISGGGRCNVTHACFEPRELVKNYPRGHRELLGPFTQFSPSDTINWFQKRGVQIKKEADGRMFPVTDSSETIIECLLGEVRKLHIEVRTSARIEAILPKNGDFELKIAQQERTIIFQKIMVAAGSSLAVWKILEDIGHRIIEPVPSLFTFNVKDARISELLGVSVGRVSVHFRAKKLTTVGPILITHWGLSGPAILKLSALAARDFHALNYNFPIEINWLFDKTRAETLDALAEIREISPKKMVISTPHFNLPNRLWQKLVAAAEIDDQKRWADLSKKSMEKLVEQLAACPFEVRGKSTFKEEFVTAGGVDLREIDFKTFQSKLHPGLFLAGEIIDVDAVTGGFNFQAAWTGGWLAGTEMAKSVI
jgi:predicted Rossmann fold flavoprotein